MRFSLKIKEENHQNHRRNCKSVLSVNTQKGSVGFLRELYHKYWKRIHEEYKLKKFEKYRNNILRKRNSYVSFSTSIQSHYRIEKM